MSVLSGHKRYERYIKTSNGYQLASMKTYADSVHFSDESTAQNNLGSIKGITSSLTATSTNVALSASAGTSLQNQINTTNSNLSLRNVTNGNFETSDIIQDVIAYRSGNIVIVSFTVKAGLSGWVSDTLTTTLKPIIDVSCTTMRAPSEEDNAKNISCTFKAEDGKVYMLFEQIMSYTVKFSCAYFTAS